MPVIVISGYYGAGNTGDETILAAMLQALKREVPQAEMVVLSRNPAQTTTDHGVAALHHGLRRDLGAKLRLFRRADLLLSGGGGLLQDCYPRRILPVSVLYYLSVCILARLRGCKVMLYAQGVGPLRTRLARWLVRVAGDRTDLITVRDKDSAVLLAQVGVGRPPIRLAADAVLAWEPRLEADLLARFVQDAEQPFFSLSLRPWSDEAYLETMARIADRLVRELQLRPVFVPFDRAMDPGISRRVRALMQEAEQAVILPVLLPSAVFAVIARARFVLAARLHAVIFAAMAGTIPIGLVYDPKLTAFLDDLGLPELACPLNASADAIWQTLTMAGERREAIVKTMAERTAVLRERALMNAELARELLASRPRA